MKAIQIADRAMESSLHSHGLWELHAVTSGSLQCTCGGKRAVLDAGDVLFVPAGMPHLLGDAGELLTIRLDLKQLLEGSPYLYALDHPEAFGSFLKKDSVLFGLVLALVECCRLTEFGWELRSLGLALEIVGSLLSRHCERSLLHPRDTGDNAARYVRWILEHIQCHYHTAISLDQLAGELGLTKSYICRVFKEHTGTTIIHYANRLRCEKAITLVESGHSITQAALQVGFNDYNYFSRVFKKTIGKRPSDFIGKA